MKFDELARVIADVRTYSVRCDQVGAIDALIIAIAKALPDGKNRNLFVAMCMGLDESQ